MSVCRFTRFDYPKSGPILKMYFICEPSCLRMGVTFHLQVLLHMPSRHKPLYIKYIHVYLLMKLNLYLLCIFTIFGYQKGV